MRQKCYSTWLNACCADRKFPFFIGKLKNYFREIKNKLQEHFMAWNRGIFPYGDKFELLLVTSVGGDAKA